MTTPAYTSTSYAPMVPRGTITLTADEQIRRGDPLMIVPPPGEPGRVRRVGGVATAVSFAGIAAHDCRAGEKLAVFAGGGAVHEGRCAGAITAGDQLLPGGTDAQVRPLPGPIDAATDLLMARGIVGVALNSAPSGGIVRWISYK